MPARPQRFCRSPWDVDQARFALRVFSQPELVVERGNIFLESGSEELINDTKLGHIELVSSAFFSVASKNARSKSSIF